VSWLRRHTQRIEDAERAAELRQQAAEQLEQERARAVDHARLADDARETARKNGFSEAMEALYRRHLGATP
jgi:hypothetical protein